jgi:AMP phosphorylase
MKLVVKDMDIATGGTQVVILNRQDAALLDLHHEDRLLIRNGRKTTTAILDIAESAKAVPSGEIGVFEEVLDELMVVQGDTVDIAIGDKPRSVAFIKRKLDGHELTEHEILDIVRDIVKGKLSSIELTTFVTANYVHGMSKQETVDLTRAMVQTGDVLRKRPGITADIHCIGGVPGNRTTLVVVPILVAAGLRVPKTASRAITSPSGTADTMEVLCSVSLDKGALEHILNQVGGFITWGGAINLAPADDRIIRIEHPLQIDAEGQMLASIMAKKAVVNATHLLMDIPFGNGSKVPAMRQAMTLRNHFEGLAKTLGIKMKVMFSDGSQPIGHGIGPALEARDCLWVLENDERGPANLRKKSIEMAGIMLEFTGKAAKGKGEELAESLLESGRAHNVMMRICRLQGGRAWGGDDIHVAPLVKHIYAPRDGTIAHVDNAIIGRIARLAGAPIDKGAGVYLHVHRRSKVRKGDPLLAIHADNKVKMHLAFTEAQEKGVIRING